jgi:hypothetical protein
MSESNALCYHHNKEEQAKEQVEQAKNKQKNEKEKEARLGLTKRLDRPRHKASDMQ